MKRLAPKRKGELAELRFWTEATRRGMIVSKPYGDSARYDFIVDCAGKLNRVQVKSSGSMSHSAFAINSCDGRRGPYRRDDVDYLIAYIVPRQTWYIIPLGEIGQRTTVYVSGERTARHRLERFKERWDLLGEGKENGE